MASDLNRWWFHIWQRPTWAAVGYLILVALRAMMIGGGIMVLMSDVPTMVRAIIAAVVSAGMSIVTGILGLRAQLGEDW